MFYGAATVQAQAVAGKHAFVVGGGNSAGQAALHLSKYAKQVSILVRSASLATSTSEYLIREIDNAPNVELRDRASGTVESVPAAGLFVLIGAEPFTEWLPEQIGRDDWGYVLTGPDVDQHPPTGRAPFLLETNMPGVFAVGDVRHGSIKWVASAVGEGSICIRLTHDCLALSP